MFGVNMERGKALMRSIQCPNGNCPQENCLLHHANQPPTDEQFEVDERGYRRGIPDRAEIPDVRGSTNNEEEEEIAQAIQESLIISMTCQYCNKVFSSKDELQWHHVEDCNTMDNCKEVGHSHRTEGESRVLETGASWMDQEEQEAKERSKTEIEEESRRKKDYEVPREAINGKNTVVEEREKADEEMAVKMAI